jgi:hypothetical protein
VIEVDSPGICPLDPARARAHDDPDARMTAATDERLAALRPRAATGSGGGELPLSRRRRRRGAAKATGVDCCRGRNRRRVSYGPGAAAARAAVALSRRGGKIPALRPLFGVDSAAMLQ